MNLKRSYFTITGVLCFLSSLLPAPRPIVSSLPTIALLDAMTTNGCGLFPPPSLDTEHFLVADRLTAEQVYP